MYWPRLATALLIAAHLWGPAPCGTPGVKFVDPVAPTDIAWVVAGDCTIYLSDKHDWNTNPAGRCTTIVHEWGHLTGHGHSDDPTNPMYPNFTYAYWRCDILHRRMTQAWLHKPIKPSPRGDFSYV